MRMGTLTMTPQKKYISGFLFIYFFGSLGFYFLRLKLCEQKTIMLLSEDKQIIRTFLFSRSRSLENSKKGHSLI